MKNTNGKKIIISLFIFIVGLLVGGGLVMSFGLKDRTGLDNNNGAPIPEITGTVVENVTIKNAEVSKLFEYVAARFDVYRSCVGFYYYNSFKNLAVDEKIMILLTGDYADDNQILINEETIKKLSANDREFVSGRSYAYIDADLIRTGMKSVFNIDVKEFKTGDDVYGLWTYLEESDVFVNGSGGGGKPWYKEQIIKYNELANEINLTVAKVDFGVRVSDDIEDAYRSASDESTLVFENVPYEKFKFTKENVDKFQQLKYIFKKNSRGKYYLYDIVNLNYTNDTSAWCD